jgi:hypothetical protein
MEKSNINERVLQLKNFLGVKIPPSTLRRWASDGLIFKPELKIDENGERSWVWPQEIVEQAAVVRILRNEKVPWASIEKRGAPRASGRNKDNRTIPTKALLAARAVVDRFYATLDEARRTAKPSMFCALEVPAQPVYLFMDAITELRDAKEKWPDNTLSLLGDAKLHDLILMWIVTLEKIRHGRSLHKPAAVVFSWKKIVSHDDDSKKLLKIIYDGVSFEHSDEDMLRVHCWTTPEALEFKKMRLKS